MREWNRPQWDGQKRGFYEVWYFKLNLGSGKPALWLRLTTLHSKDGSKKIAETWGIFFDPSQKPTSRSGVKTTYPSEAFQFDATTDTIQIGPCYWSPGRTAGEIASVRRKIRWDLQFVPDQGGEFNHVPEMFARFKLNKSTVCTPEMKIRFNGKFWIDDEEFVVKDAPGQQGHIYGKKNAHGWAWAHCCAEDSGETFAFEGLTARLPLLGGMILSPPISAFYVEFEGRPYAFTTVREALSMPSQYNLKGWKFSMRRDDLEFQGEITAQTSDFAGVQYEDTDGSSLYCHNSKVSTLEMKVLRCTADSKSVIKTFHATQTCAFEVVTREKSDEVPFLI